MPSTVGCSSDHTQDNLKRRKARLPQAESKPRSQVVSLSLSMAGMVLAFALGWGSRGMHPADAAQSGPDVWEHTTHPGMRDGFNWTQLSMSRSNNFPPTFVRHLSVEEVQQGGAFSVWHRTYARSIPALISGLARNWSIRIGAWTLDDFLREWGDQPVTVAFSQDEKFQRGIAHPTEGRVVLAPDRLQLPFREFVRLQREQQSRRGGPIEHIAVQQSPSRSFAEFGLPSLPPLLEELVGPTLQARNFWAAVPPKTSVLHYDWQDRMHMHMHAVHMPCTCHAHAMHMHMHISCTCHASSVPHPC